LGAVAGLLFLFGLGMIMPGCGKMCTRLYWAGERTMGAIVQVRVKNGTDFHGHKYTHYYSTVYFLTKEGQSVFFENRDYYLDSPALYGSVGVIYNPSHPTDGVIDTRPIYTILIGIAALLVGLLVLSLDSAKDNEGSSVLSSGTAKALGLCLLGLCILSCAMRFFFNRRDLGDAEGATKVGLGAIRSVLLGYHNDIGGKYPSNLDTLALSGNPPALPVENDPKRLPWIPVAMTPPYHQDTPMIHYGNKADDAGGWLYNNVVGDPRFGTVSVNCTHTDAQGTAWDSY
jgi:hypothetical protein